MVEAAEQDEVVAVRPTAEGPVTDVVRVQSMAADAAREAARSVAPLEAGPRWRRHDPSSSAVIDGAVESTVRLDELAAAAPAGGGVALLAVGLDGRANERAFAKSIRIYLEGDCGRPQLKQRPHDDLKGAPSLFV